MEKVTIKLRHPIQFGSQIVEELTIRPVTAKDLRQLPTRAGFEMDTVIILAGRLSGQPDAVINGLTGEDLEEVIALVSGFMPGGRLIGVAPSES